MPRPFLFKELFLKEVAKTKGMVNCHAHLDRAYTLTEENFALSNTLMEEKWVLNRDIKKAHTRESLIKRFEDAIALFIEQGIIACRTFVDADNIVDMLCINTAAEMREKYKGKFILQLAPQPLEGFLNEEATDFDKHKVDLFEKACAICDVVGGLPSRDRKFGDGGRKHADFLFSVAKNLNKDIDVHIDQENNPYEKDTEWFLDKIVENHMEGRVTLVHALSVSCQSTEDRKRIYKKMVDTNTNVTVCPKAVITMKQHKDKMAPVHNSIAQVDEMLEAGVNVSLGTDNISDIIVPDCSGDLTDEVLMLAAACRLYDIPKLAAVATTNGYKTLKLKI
ncbi:MAG: amidohydrolase family protein [Candidatus Gracilibacteria bacterium]